MAVCGHLVHVWTKKNLASLDGTSPDQIRPRFITSNVINVLVFFHEKCLHFFGDWRRKKYLVLSRKFLQKNKL
jgi:hypothetical protein